MLSQHLSLIHILLLAIALRRRFRAPWLLWSAGAVAFFLSQAVHLPLNNLLGDLGLIGPIGPDAPNLLRTAVVLGLSAGLCEGLLRLLTFWWLNRRGLVEHWSGAVMVGLGHGGFEAMILAAMTALSAAALLALRGADLTDVYKRQVPARSAMCSRSPGRMTWPAGAKTRRMPSVWV